MTNKLNIADERYHAYLCHAYCELSHSNVLALGHCTTRGIDYCLFDLTPELLQSMTKLEQHSRGMRLRFHLTGSEFYRACKRYGLIPQTKLSSREYVEERRADIIAIYPNVSPKTFNTGRVFESLLADRLKTTWSYDPREPRFDLASDLETPDMRVQCKLTNSSINESAILNALHDANIGGKQQ